MHELEDLLTTILQAHGPQELELIGKTLSCKQFLNVLDELEKHRTDYTIHLSPILVGLSPSVFQESLSSIQPAQLEALRREATAEPLQHQLTIFLHALEVTCTEISLTIDQLFKKIYRLNVDHINKQHLDEIHSEGIFITGFIQQQLKNIGIALALAWNTTRVDLVDRLSNLKERLLNVENLQTQVEFWLKKHCDAVFGNPENLEEIDAVSDEDPAIEGLAKFSLWYPEDYWEVGLIPHLTKKEELFDQADLNENSREERIKELMGIVEKNLTKMGLYTVADLKHNQIYSRVFLEDFLARSGLGSSRI